MGRRLGQHFLNDKKILAAIAREALSANNCIIEIGPGHGELTEQLLTLSGELQVVAIEKDGELIPHLSSLQTKYKNLEIIQGDVREILPELTKSSKLKTKNCTIVGNIPYYLTGYLLRLIGKLAISDPKLITRVVVVIQKEVAERVCAVAPHANLLSSIIRGWAEPMIGFAIPRSAFSPPPKVDSALLTLVSNGRVPERTRSRYFEMVRIVFTHPRKTLANNLAHGFALTRARAERIVADLGLPREARGALLTPAHLITLAETLYDK
ncbi:MAG: ribosomal RNA small subunit methyltransferase A [Candidatus Brennerbacteria bacterium]|nr:ribosomal RNA small subunit methyltransferase A [Candidatus Brennerbacteria bacterium]